MKNRTKTYLAGDWTGDSDLIEKIKEWNQDNRFQLHFTDVHDLTSSSDNSNSCSIKTSLRQRLSISKTFVLIVGEHTKYLRKGACYLCKYYSPYSPYNNNFEGSCSRSIFNVIDNCSFVEYECKKAYKDYLKGDLKNLVVIYNGLTSVDKSKCPEILKNVGTHIPSDIIREGKRYWNYQDIKNAICK